MATCLAVFPILGPPGYAVHRANARCRDPPFGGGLGQPGGMHGRGPPRGIPRRPGLREGVRRLPRLTYGCSPNMPAVIRTMNLPVGIHMATPARVEERQERLALAEQGADPGCRAFRKAIVSPLRALVSRLIRRPCNHDQSTSHPPSVCSLEPFAGGHGVARRDILIAPPPSGDYRRRERGHGHRDRRQPYGVSRPAYRTPNAKRGLGANKCASTMQRSRYGVRNRGSSRSRPYHTAYGLTDPFGNAARIIC